MKLDGERGSRGLTFGMCIAQCVLAHVAHLDDALAAAEGKQVAVRGVERRTGDHLRTREHRLEPQHETNAPATH